MTVDLTGKSYFISGGAKGLGKAIAVGLTAAGAKVGIADIDEASLNATLEDIKATGGDIVGYVGDLSSFSVFHGFGAAFAEEAGGIDGVINNASLLIYEPINEVSEETLDTMLGAGLKSSVWGSQVLVKHRKPDTTANIINFSSPVAYKGYPNASIYSAIKSATTSLTRTLAAELGPQNIRVNALAPGSIPTPGALQYVDEKEYARRAASIPLRRIGHEDDILGAIKFLLSDDAAFVNGAILNVDGGIIASA